MAQVRNPPSDHSPENPPANQSSSDSHKPNTDDNNSFSRHKHSKVMENCIALFLKFGAAASPTKTLSPKQKALIEQRLLDSFPVHLRPDHLPYAAMIVTAISKLNEKGGSSEEAISNFIREENDDLPWAHDMFVKHHLENLCKDGSIFKTRYGLYTTTTDRVSTDTDPSISSSTSYIQSSSNSDSDVSVSKIRKGKLHKGRLSRIKVETKMRRLRRMKKEKESKEDTVDDGLIMETNTSRVKQRSDKNEEKNLSLEEYQKVNRIKTKEKTIKKQFTEEVAIVALNGHDQDDNQKKVMKIQMDRQEAEAQEKQFDHLIEGKRGVTGLKDKPLPEETNQLQEHNVAPIREQCCVKKRDHQLPKGNRNGQKARIKPAGRRRGKRSNNNELSVNELNEEQKLIEVLNAIKRDKKGKVLVEEQTEHTALRSQFAEETEHVRESGKHEAFGAGKGEVVVAGKDEKQKQHVIVFGLLSSSCTFGTKCSIVDLKPGKSDKNSRK